MVYTALQKHRGQIYHRQVGGTPSIIEERFPAYTCTALEAITRPLRTKVAAQGLTSSWTHANNAFVDCWDVVPGQEIGFGTQRYHLRIRNSGVLQTLAPLELYRAVMQQALAGVNVLIGTPYISVDCFPNISEQWDWLCAASGTPVMGPQQFNSVVGFLNGWLGHSGRSWT